LLKYKNIKDLQRYILKAIQVKPWTVIQIEIVIDRKKLFGNVYSANFVVKKWYFDSVYFVCSN